MGLLSYFREKLNPAQPVIYEDEGPSSSSTVNYTVTKAYYEVDIVNRGVNLLVDACSGITYDVAGKIRNTGVVVSTPENRITKKRILKLLNYRPNPFQNADAFKRAIFLDLIIEGNIFIYFDGMHLFHLPASSVEIHSDKKTYIKGYTYGDVTFAPEEIIHVKENSVNSIYRGDSRLLAALPAINSLKSMLAYQKTFFDNNAIPGLVLRTPNTLSQRVKDRILADWIQRYNPKRGGKRPAILDGDFSIENLGHTDFRELDFKESILIQETNILKALGIPPILLDSGNNANISPNQKLFYNNTVLPLVNKVIAAFEFYFGFDIKANLHDVIALRPDMKEEAQYFTGLVNGGIITPNEAREKLRYEKVEGGDEIRVPANIAGSAANPLQGGKPPNSKE